MKRVLAKGSAIGPLRGDRYGDTNGDDTSAYPGCRTVPFAKEQCCANQPDGGCNITNLAEQYGAAFLL